MHKRKLSIIAAAITALISSNVVMAGEKLAPGKPAGVKPAQMEMTDTVLGLGLAVAAIAITIGVTSGPGNSGTTSTAVVSTSTTS